MNDKEWERLRFRVRLDRWTTIAAWVLFSVCFATAVTSALTAEWPRAAAFAILAAACLATARWHPRLVKIEDVEGQ